MMLVAATPPNLTAVGSRRPVPVTVTRLPPAVGPAEADTPVTVGAFSKAYWSAKLVADVPPGEVTVTSTSPDPAGATILSDVSELTTRPVPGTPLKAATVARVNPVPVTVTAVPPAVGPAVGATPVMTGVGA